jgi:hypothetical protein
MITWQIDTFIYITKAFDKLLKLIKSKRTKKLFKKK